VQDRAIVTKLFDTIAPRFAERAGGYTRLLRLGYRKGDSAEIAFAVANRYQRRGIGSVLARELAADARAAGIRELRATVRGDNLGAVALITRSARIVATRWCAGEREFVTAL